jgi:hypothetical protein
MKIKNKEYFDKKKIKENYCYHFLEGNRNIGKELQVNEIKKDFLGGKMQEDIVKKMTLIFEQRGKISRHGSFGIPDLFYSHAYEEAIEDLKEILEGSIIIIDCPKCGTVEADKKIKLF